MNQLNLDVFGTQRSQRHRNRHRLRRAHVRCLAIHPVSMLELHF